MEEKNAIRTHRDLEVWQKAMELVREVYARTRSFPREEVFGLSLQLRRAAVSVPSNIAEGHGRTGVQEFLHGLSVAMGSLTELDTQVDIAADLRYMRAEERDALRRRVESLAMMMNALIRSLRRRSGR